jgi:hypothetical protein
MKLDDLGKSAVDKRPHHRVYCPFAYSPPADLSVNDSAELTPSPEKEAATGRAT